MEPGSPRPTVLVVDDDDQVRDLYTTWLAEEYTVHTAKSGAEALETVDGGVDVVLLDRRMPDMPGDDVLTEVRTLGHDCRVVMLTAVDPDMDIIDMEFDDYVTKPVSETELAQTVETMIARSNYGEQLQEYFAVASKRATLETELTEEELSASDEYAQLVEQAEELRDSLDRLLSDLTRYEDFDSAFSEL
ncbi:HalX domain-containing protein [Halostella pelagica]|uniref:HalX domain-containing protein n=1 Tax=Halostella pelagica TaxID=2583824 RepID=UPI0010819325|nr:HalX domain-containing protein [Halostella pelagica]